MTFPSGKKEVLNGPFCKTYLALEIRVYFIKRVIGDKIFVGILFKIGRNRV